MSTRIHNYAAGSLPRDIELVVFGWSNHNGHCVECGCPAAFRRNELTDDILCAVCAANAAADGEDITRIEEIE